MMRVLNINGTYLKRYTLTIRIVLYGWLLRMECQDQNRNFLGRDNKNVLFLKFKLIILK